MNDLFGLPVTEFRAEVEPCVDDVPAMSFAAAFTEDADVFRNHERARAAVAGFAGTDAVAGLAKNALEHRWTFGPYGVVLTTFPRERNLTRTNPLYEKNPDLWDQTTVRLEAAVAWPDPDAGLAAIVDPSCQRLEIPRAGGVALGSGVPHANRIHPKVVRDAMPLDALVAWRGVANRQGLSNRVATITWTAASAISLTRQRPARGPGGATLQVDRATLLIHRDASGLDALAEELARFFELPLSRTTIDDD